MNSSIISNRCLLMVAAALVALAAGALAESPEWTPPSTDAVRLWAMTWLDRSGVKEDIRQRAEQLWADVYDLATAEERLSALAETFALADPRAERLVRLCAGPRKVVSPSEFAWLAEPDVQPLESANLRLLVGCWMVRQSFHDEALQQFAALRPEEVVDPASLLFHRAVAHHWLLHKEEGLEAIDGLLAGRQFGPRRYMALAQLMREDLAAVEEDTLDHIARRMRDIERRLDLGRTGPKVREIEDGVIKSLDKRIKELEDQQCQGGGDSIFSTKPADDSKLMGGKGPGEINRKKATGKSGWGNLPPKQREKALQEVGRQYPSHYRDVIEQYFRKMAGEKPAESSP